MHVDVDNPSTSKCGSSDYKSDNMNDRNICVKSKPIFSCEVCDLTFNSESKLKSHVCQIIVINPAYGDYYTKDLIINIGCTVIFSKSEESEVLILHSQQCLNGINRCPDLPAHNYDGDTWHAPLNDFFSEGKIIWENLGNFSIRIS